MGLDPKYLGHFNAAGSIDRIRRGESKDLQTDHFHYEVTDKGVCLVPAEAGLCNHNHKSAINMIDRGLWERCSMNGGPIQDEPTAVPHVTSEPFEIETQSFGGEPITGGPAATPIPVPPASENIALWNQFAAAALEGTMVSHALLAMDAMASQADAEDTEKVIDRVCKLADRMVEESLKRQHREPANV